MLCLSYPPTPTFEVKEKNFYNPSMNEIEKVCYFLLYLPGTGPHTRGIISNIAEHDGSSKHSCRARIQFKMAIAILTLGPVMRK